MTKYIPMPVVDWIGTDAPDPRDAYTVRINGHVVGVHSQEESARNHAWTLEAYIKGGHDPIDWPWQSTPDVLGLVEALQSVWLWMENQADAQSKGGHATFDLMALREQRDIASAAIAKATAAEGGE